MLIFCSVSSYNTYMLETPNYKEKSLDKEHITKKRPYNTTKYITMCHQKELLEGDKKKEVR